MACSRLPLVERFLNSTLMEEHDSAVTPQTGGEDPCCPLAVGSAGFRREETLLLQQRHRRATHEAISRVARHGAAISIYAAPQLTGSSTSGHGSSRVSQRCT